MEEKSMLGRPELPEEIKNNDLYKFNEYCTSLLAEAEVYLSYFEVETDYKKDCKKNYNNSKIGPSFAWIQKAMLESLFLSLARMFDNMCKDKEKYTIQELLKKALEEKDMLQRYADTYKNDYGNVEAKIKEFQDKLNTPEIDGILKRNKDFRNQYLAHNDIKKCDITIYPVNVEELKTILSLASDITNYIHCCLTGKKYKPWTENNWHSPNGYIWFHDLFMIAEDAIASPGL